MEKTPTSRLIPFIAVAALFCLAAPAFGEELIVKSCPELLRMAENYQHDLKTTDTVLGAAIEQGNMDRIQNFKLKKNVLKKELESVLKAIDLKGCAKTK